MSERMSRRYRIRWMRYRIYEWLRRHGPATAAEIHDALEIELDCSISAPSVVGYLRSMCHLGYVTHKIDDSDRMAKSQKVGQWSAVEDRQPPPMEGAAPSQLRSGVRGAPPRVPDDIAITDEERALQAYWRLSRAERRKLAAEGKAPAMVSA
ncbi:MAG: MarR family winged helix-turn-helix transcriptional regulator [Candidatus Contendobacter sp.]|nr:MarR family winged helix-turn-helix transcriptional regulator [Candidatus Contendobacter sp.]